LLLDSATRVPPTGAAAASCTVHRLLPPPVRAAGLHPSEEMPPAVAPKLSSVVWTLDPSVAVSWLAPDWVLLSKLALKVALGEPVGTVTDAGTLMAAWLLLRATVVPGAGETCDSTRVQVADPPGDRVVGAQERDNRFVTRPSEGAEREKTTFRLIPEAVAVTVML
jgi:hypothetical protein